MNKLIYLLILLFSFSVLSAQEKLSKKEKERRENNIQLGNPFKKFGYKAKVATLSNGKYLEFHDLDSIVTIGTVRWHVNKNLIVGRIVPDSLNPDTQPIGDRVGRWISPDPLSEEFPSWSPYNMCYDNPVKFVDPDGRAVDNEYDWNLTTGKTTLVSTKGGDKTDYINVVVNGKKDFTYTKNVKNEVANIQNGSEIGSSFTERGPGYKKTTNILPTSGAGQDPTVEIFGTWAGGKIAGAILGTAFTKIASFIEANRESKVFRVFGGDAKPNSFSWTTENPNTITNFRDAAGLPSGGASGSTNSGRFVIEGSVKNKNIMGTRSALPLDGNVGGLKELIIDPKNVRINRVSGANPKF